MKRVVVLLAAVASCSPEAKLPASLAPPAVVVSVDNPQVSDEDQRAMAREVEDALRFASDRLGVCTVDTVYVWSAALADEMTERTGADASVASITRGDSLYTQRPDALAARGLLRLTVKHESVHLCLARVSTRIPRWLEEGLAILMAGEAPDHPPLRGEIAPDSLDALLQSRDPHLRLGAASTAFDAVRELQVEHDWAAIRVLLSSIAHGASFDDAFKRAFGREVPALFQSHG